MKRIVDFLVAKKEILLYLVFGALTTAVSFGTAWIAKAVLEGSPLMESVSTVFSWICAVTFAYLTNRKWVFESTAHGAPAILREIVSFYGGRVATLLFETACMQVVAGWLGVNYWVTKIAANVVVLILNYVISKWLVFKKKKDK